MTRLAPCALAAVCLLAMRGEPIEAQWQGSIALEGQAFPSAWGESPELGLLLTAREAVELGGGVPRLTLEPFLLLDPTGSRTLLDFPELALTARGDDWEGGVGSRVIFWGVVESTHRVDVINQRLPRSTTQGYQKLGQPMIFGRWLGHLGTLEAFLLPGFRERPFSGRAGRTWTNGRVDGDRSRSESRSGRHAVDWAVRWSHAAGAWDLALSHFSGRSRDPLLEETSAEAAAPVSRPVYPLVDQTSIELQWTREAWLFKLEALTRSGGPARHRALAGGVEYAVGDHLGFFAEYAYDTGGSNATTSLERDAFLGGRLLTHEEEVEVGLLVDTSSGNRLARAAVRRRLAERLTLAFEARGFWGDPTREPVHSLRQDSFLSIALQSAF